MNFSKTEIEGLWVLDPIVYNDDRGHFFESYSEASFKRMGLPTDWVQDNHSQSKRGCIRGLHFQLGESAQAKLVRCVWGKVLDVVVDLRAGSKTYGRKFSIELSYDNKKMLYIPRGFAHGFSTLSHMAMFHYKCDNHYNKAAECGIIYNDPELDIDWMIDAQPIVSEKDLKNLTLSEYTKRYIL